MSRPTLYGRLHAKLRAAYIRFLLKHAAFDIEVMQADAAAMPARIRYTREQMLKLQRELAGLEAQR